jgi:hypothetical protein
LGVTSTLGLLFLAEGDLGGRGLLENAFPKAWNGSARGAEPCAKTRPTAAVRSATERAFRTVRAFMDCPC